MTESAIAYTEREDSGDAGNELARQLSDALRGERPDALIVFAPPRYDHATLLGAIKAGSRAEVIVGASSAGGFANGSQGADMACALALRSSTLKFGAGIGRGLSENRGRVAGALVSTFTGLESSVHPYRAALVMTDALAGHSDQLVDELTLATAGRYQFFGGGAGDNAEFRSTPVFYGTEVLSDAAVALEILSTKPIGIGVGHGWEPASAPMRVTEASGARLFSLNGAPAIQAFEKHARATGQVLDQSAPIPFFLHNAIGIDVGGAYRLRVPLAIHADGSIVCAADIAVGTLVQIMRTTNESAIGAATCASDRAMAALKGEKASVALFFDCVATRLRLGDAFGFELQALADGIGGAPFVGCNTHGQIARGDGQFSGFHNCTAVVSL